MSLLWSDTVGIFFHKKINLLSSALVIEHLSKYRLSFPRMHSNTDSFDSYVIFLVSSRWKKYKLHAVSSYTLISVTSHAKRSYETSSVWCQKLWAISYVEHLPSGFPWNVHLVSVKRIQRISKALVSKQNGKTLTHSTATLFQRFRVV